MRATINTTGATFIEARSRAVDAFDAFFGEGHWRFDGSTAEPSLYAMGQELPQSWACQFHASNIDVGRGAVKK